MKIWKEKGIDAAIAANNGVELDSTHDDESSSFEQIINKKVQELFSSRAHGGFGAGRFPKLIIEESDLAEMAKGLEDIDLNDNNSSGFTPIEDSE